MTCNSPTLLAAAKASKKVTFIVTKRNGLEGRGLKTDPSDTGVPLPSPKTEDEQDGEGALTQRTK